MGYLCAALSVLSGAIKGFCGKKISGQTNGLREAVLFNSVRMFLCAVIGLVLSLILNGSDSLALVKADYVSILMSGVFSAVFVVSWLLTVKNGAYLMLDVFLMLGVIVPLIGGHFLFDETIAAKQWLGYLVLVAAALLLCSYNRGIKSKFRGTDYLVLALCGIANGLSDFSQKIFVNSQSSTPISTFNLYSYLISFLMLILCFLLFKKAKTDGAAGSKSKMVLLYLVIMAVCLFLNSFFQTMAAQYLSSAELFPMSKSLALILSVIMAAVFFHEKVNFKCILGVILAFIGILVINL